MNNEFKEMIHLEHVAMPAYMLVCVPCDQAMSNG